MFEINENAPVIAKEKTEINAAPEIVWNIMANIEAWPKWNPDVKKACLKGELEEGTQFQWKTGVGKITSLLQQVEPPHILAWTGRIMGINAIHIWKIEPVDGKTMVKTEESWEGALSRIMKGRMQKMLQESLNSGLEYLKTEAERVAAL
ncbi:MAG TPA: SRPBCC family protein [Methanobacteriaceae archaeon]|nr:SRPBCC family protein [Methanobacteriaceae archaeon]